MRSAARVGFVAYLMIVPLAWEQGAGREMAIGLPDNAPSEGASRPADICFEATVPGRIVEVRLGCDAEELRIRVDAPDESPEQEFTGTDIWRGDSLQIGFDLLDDDCPLSYAPDDAEYGFALHGDVAEVVCWQSGEAEMSTAGIAVAAVYDAGERAYRYDCRIPWRRLRPFIRGLPGMDRFGFCVLVNDFSAGIRACAESRPGMWLRKHPAVFDTLVPLGSFDPVRPVPADMPDLALRVEWPDDMRGEDLVPFSLQNPQGRYGLLETTVSYLEIPAAESTRAFSTVKGPEEGSVYVRSPWPGRYRVEIHAVDLEANTRSLLAEHVVERSDGRARLVHPALRRPAAGIDAGVAAAVRSAARRHAGPYAPSFEQNLAVSAWDEMLESTIDRMQAYGPDGTSALPLGAPPVLLMQTDPTRNCVDPTVEWVQRGEGPAGVLGLRNEHEGMAILVANYGPETIRLKIDLVPLDREGVLLPTVLHKAVHVKGLYGLPTADALVPLAAPRLLAIEPSRVEQIYLDIALEGPPGIYRGAIDIVVVGGANRHYRFPIQAEVLPVDLPDPMPVHVAGWPAYAGESGAYGTDLAALMADMSEHHMNVQFLLGRLPLDRDGRPGALPEWDDVIEHGRRPGWLLLVGGVFPDERNDGFESVESRGDLETRIRWMIDYLEQQKGLDRSEYAFYPVDEPGAGGIKVRRLRNFSRVVKSISADLRVYTNPFDGFGPESYEEFSDDVDIFCPNTGLFLHGGLGRDRLDVSYLWARQVTYRGRACGMWPRQTFLPLSFRIERSLIASLAARGKDVWCYDCEPMAKTLPPVEAYRSRGWVAWHFGLTGFGFFSYNRGGGERLLWFGSPQAADHEYAMVYPGCPGIVPSRRWEACRDGAEDYAVCALLRAEHDRTRDPTVREQVRVLLEDRVESFLAAEVGQSLELFDLRADMLRLLRDCRAGADAAGRPADVAPGVR